MRLDGFLWVGIPLIAVGLWLVHDGPHWRHDLCAPRKTSRLFLRLQDYLVQADLERWTPWRVLLVCVLGAIVAGIAAQVLGWPLATGVAVLLGALAPVGWVQGRHGRVHAETRQGLAAALSRLAGSLAVGHTIERGAQTLATDGPERLRPHFVQFCRDVEDHDLPGAAIHLRTSLADPIADLFVAGLLLHTELGGDDFRPMLSQLEQMTRAKQSIRDQIAAARVRLRYSSYVLVGAPIALLLALRSWSPVIAAYFDTPEGIGALCVCALAIIAGYVLMQYLGRMPGDERVLVR